MNDKEKTLEDVSPEAFGLIMALSEKAYARLSEPDFVRVLPPPEEKVPATLVYSWGVEMLRLGFELAAEMFLPEEDNDDRYTSQHNLQR